MRFSLKELFLALTLLTLGIIGVICVTGPLRPRFGGYFLFLGSVLSIAAVPAGLFHRGLAKAMLSVVGVLAGLGGLLLAANFLLR